MNVRDSELVEGIMLDSGYARASDPSEADVILVLTCAVRERAEVRALGRATQLAGGTGRAKPLVALCGCVAQEHGAELLERFPGIDLVVGPDCYGLLPGLLSGGVRVAEVTRGFDDYEDLPSVRSMFPRAFVTVTRGCDNYCSYCIVPHVRGGERSRPAEKVIQEVESLAASGFRDITLLGQNVNSYRSGGDSFPELLRRVARVAGPAWIRFVTSHPRDLTESLVQVMAEEPCICPSLHLPAQSGSDRILGAMNRGYSREEYLEKTALLRKMIPGIALSTDMIAGFPGETEEDFQMSLSLLSEVRFDYGFLFRYSERKGTPAASISGSVPVKDRLQRLYRLQETQNRITLEKSRELTGRTVKVLVTGPGREEGQLTCRTRCNRTVVVPDSGSPPGSFLDAEIVEARGWTHHGEVR